MAIRTSVVSGNVTTYTITDVAGNVATLVVTKTPGKSVTNSFTGGPLIQDGAQMYAQTLLETATGLTP